MDRPRITLFTQTGCDESARTRAWLQQRGVSFHERNVYEDPSAAQALAATGIFATPLLVIGDETILGFRPNAFEAALQAAGIHYSALQTD